MRGGGPNSWSEQPQLLGYENTSSAAHGSAANGGSSRAGNANLPDHPKSTHTLSSRCAACAHCYQHILDRSTPHTIARWFFFLALLACYGLRISLIKSHHIITYAYAIYLLSLLIGFLTPKIDPAWTRVLREAGLDDESDNGDLLPNNSKDEFRPFMRRLPEFRCWLNATRATLIAFGCTLTRIFDVPVFWPVLVVYFIMLFVLTMKRQIAHMLRYRYVPFSIGKQRYSDRPHIPNAATGGSASGAPLLPPLPTGSVIQS